MKYAWQRAQWKGKLIVCETCGKTVRVPPSVYKQGKRFCSAACYDKSGANNPKWKGGKVDFEGRRYIYAPGHPNATTLSGNHVAEHRLVMAQHLGRALTSKEVVHHINGDKSDNRLENLEVLTHRDHLLRHLPEVTKARLASDRKGPRGSQVGGSKLKEANVLDIREMLSNGFTVEECAVKYRVSAGNIDCIRLGKTWRWLK